MNLSLTIPDLFLRSVREQGTKVALLTKREGKFVGETWNELASAVANTAAALQALRLAPGSRVIHVAENRREWVLFDLACHFTSLIHVPVHAPLSGPQIAAQIIHSGAEVVVLSNASQWLKLKEVAELLPQALRLFSYDAVEDERVQSWSEWLAENPATELPEAKLGENDLATILYTSGTTGEPKGVMLTQRNLSSNAQGVVQQFGPVEQGERKLNLLPLSHIFARTCDLYAWVVRGSTLALAESRETVLDDLQLVRPTTINGVPYFYERLRKLLTERGLENQPGALQSLLGGEMKFCNSGGAPLPPATIQFFEQQQVTLYQGYGLTESSPVITMSCAVGHRPGSCGRALPGVEMRIADDGELLTRGFHVMAGYYKNEPATAATIQEGWLHTGDLGAIDGDGFLHIVGRKKEMLVLSTGKKIAPAYLETLLAQEPLVAQVIVVGEGRSHLSALVVPQPEALRAEIANRKIAVTSREEALQHPQIISLYRDRFRSLLANLSPQEQIHHVTLLPRAFTLEAGEITAKLSLRREIICQHFAAEIEILYEQK